jgi:hypothetical protein
MLYIADGIMSLSHFVDVPCLLVSDSQFQQFAVKCITKPISGKERYRCPILVPTNSA